MEISKNREKRLLICGYEWSLRDKTYGFKKWSILSYYHIFIFLESDLPVIAYAELIGITIRPTVRSAIAKLMINIFDT